MRFLRLSREEAEKIADSLRYSCNGLVTAVVQDVSGRVLMVAYMDREALVKTLTTGIAHYYSRSRRSLWMKGETSGNYQYVVDFEVDCDGDAVLLRVVQVGSACHEGTYSCFDSGTARLRRLLGKTNT